MIPRVDIPHEAPDAGYRRLARGIFRQAWWDLLQPRSESRQAARWRADAFVWLTDLERRDIWSVRACCDLLHFDPVRIATQAILEIQARPLQSWHQAKNSTGIDLPAILRRPAISPELRSALGIDHRGRSIREAA